MPTYGIAMATEYAWQEAHERRLQAKRRLGLDVRAGDHWQKGRVGTGYHRGTQGVCEADVVRWVEDKHDPRAELLEAARRGVKSAVARCEALFEDGWQQTGVMREVAR